MQEMDLSVEEVDALTGTAVGWPKTGDLPPGRSGRPRHSWPRRAQRHHQHSGRAQRSEAARLLPADAGAQVAGRQNQGRLLQEARRAPTARSVSPSTGRRWNIARRSGRSSRRWRWRRTSRTCPSGCACCWRPRKTRPASFCGSALSDLWTYAANRIGEIADSVVEIDRAMKLGFNWEMGPFELWDAAGVAKTVEAHEGGRQAGFAQRREAAGLGQRPAGMPTIPRPPAAALISISQRPTTSRKKFPQACGRSRSRRSRTAW